MVLSDIGSTGFVERRAASRDGGVERVAIRRR
jgi:hypothetical protein